MQIDFLVKGFGSSSSTNRFFAFMHIGRLPTSMFAAFLPRTAANRYYMHTNLLVKGFWKSNLNKSPFRFLCMTLTA